MELVFCLFFSVFCQVVRTTLHVDFSLLLMAPGLTVLVESISMVIFVSIPSVECWMGVDGGRHFISPEDLARLFKHEDSEDRDGMTEKVVED